ncbi:peptide chain release factor 1 [bacterium]|nr:peptide chain release factor 1 [bacterium]
MFHKLDEVELHFADVETRLTSPEVVNNTQLFQKLSKEHANLQPLVETYRHFRQVKSRFQENKEMIEQENGELKDLALEENKSLESELQVLERKLKVLLLPKDPNDDKNTMVEIRPAAGGDEAGIFAGDLFKMYSKYAEKRGWQVELMEATPNDVGEDVEVDINPNDLRIDVFRSSGPGGQSVNTTDSAVRITHLPSGLVVVCRDEKSQHKNKAKALKVLKTRLLDIAQREQHSKIAADRLSQVGTGDRSEKIRTYNFPQGRVTDHRIGVTLHKVNEFVGGDIDEMLTALSAHYEAEALKRQSES